jgi:two-component system OmpR family response regulator
MKILLIEDDEVIGDAVKTSLEKADYLVEWAKNGLEGEIALTDQHFEAIILDLGLPKKGGLEILKNLRSNENFDNKILGLDLGADDYLAKPFNLQELHARLRVVIRRNNQSSDNMIEFGPLSFDIKQRAFLIKGKELNLSKRELNLLEVFILKNNRSITKEALLEKLYGWDDEISENAIEVYIHRVRKKLNPYGIEIINRRGLGYSLNLV